MLNLGHGLGGQILGLDFSHAVCNSLGTTETDFHNRFQIFGTGQDRLKETEA